MAGPMMNHRKSSFRRPGMYEINVTPFVDVMLVLLIVFMVTAPLITQGVQVNLPEVDNAALTEESEPLEVTIKNTGDIYIQAQKVKPDQLAAKLKAIRETRGPGTSILLRADMNVSYGQVMEVMSSLQGAGLVDVGLVTQPQQVTR